MRPTVVRGKRWAAPLIREMFPIALLHHAFEIPNRVGKSFLDLLRDTVDRAGSASNIREPPHGIRNQIDDLGNISDGCQSTEYLVMLFGRRAEGCLELGVVFLEAAVDLLRRTHHDVQCVQTWTVLRMDPRLQLSLGVILRHTFRSRPHMIF